MNSLRLSLVPGLIAGVLSVFTSWFLVAVVFGRYQRRTPQSWREETAGHRILSSLVQVGACLAIATMYVMVARGNAGTLGDDLYGAVWFAVIGWAAFVAPVLFHQTLYLNLHPLVSVGLLVNWLITALLASCITAWWLLRSGAL